MDITAILRAGNGLGSHNTWNGKLVPKQKRIAVGKRGGAYYINELGKRVYLKTYQKKQCVEGQVTGETNGACKLIKYHNDDVDPATQEILRFQPYKRKYGGMYIPS